MVKSLDDLREGMSLRYDCECGCKQNDLYIRIVSINNDNTYLVSEVEPSLFVIPSHVLARRLGIELKRLDEEIQW